jgi:hypothetical protein
VGAHYSSDCRGRSRRPGGRLSRLLLNCPEAFAWELLSLFGVWEKYNLVKYRYENFNVRAEVLTKCLTQADVPLIGKREE